MFFSQVSMCFEKKNVSLGSFVVF